jgi:hypothetical protein
MRRPQLQPERRDSRNQRTELAELLSLQQILDGLLAHKPDTEIFAELVTNLEQKTAQDFQHQTDLATKVINLAHAYKSDPEKINDLYVLIQKVNRQIRQLAPEDYQDEFMTGDAIIPSDDSGSDEHDEQRLTNTRMASTRELNNNRQDIEIQTQADQIFETVFNDSLNIENVENALTQIDELIAQCTNPEIRAKLENKRNRLSVYLRVLKAFHRFPIDSANGTSQSSQAASNRVTQLLQILCQPILTNSQLKEKLSDLVDRNKTDQLAARTPSAQRSLQQEWRIYYVVLTSVQRTPAKPTKVLT